MSGHVNLLLLLSALLSALTGVGGGVRQPAAAQAMAQQVSTSAIRVAAAAVTSRPGQPLPALLASAAAPATAVFALTPAEPRFAARRRE